METLTRGATTNSLTRNAVQGAMVALVLLVRALPALAAQPTTTPAATLASAAPEVSVSQRAPKSAKQHAWRGSSVSYRNSLTAVSLDKSHDQTWNPTYFMSLGIAPRWWLSDHGYLTGLFGFDYEVTNADATTDNHEVWFNDVVLGGGLSKILTIPVLKIGFSPSAMLQIPTSKVSQARTLMLALAPSLKLDRSFDVLSGLSLGYAFGATKYFYQYTTGQLESNPYGGPDGYSTDGLQEQGIEGVKSNSIWQGMDNRNAEWRLKNSFSVDLAFVDWLSLGATFGLVHDFLPAFQYDPRTDYPQSVTLAKDPPRVRYLMAYGGELGITPMPAFSVGLGFDTTNGQLGPDGQRQAPFFNRNTVVYVDLRLDIDGLFQALTQSEEER